MGVKDCTREERKKAYSFFFFCVVFEVCAQAWMWRSVTVATYKTHTHTVNNTRTHTSIYSLGHRERRIAKLCEIEGKHTRRFPSSVLFLSRVRRSGSSGANRASLHVVRCRHAYASFFFPLLHLFAAFAFLWRCCSSTLAWKIKKKKKLLNKKEREGKR